MCAVLTTYNNSCTVLLQSDNLPRNVSLWFVQHATTSRKLSHITDIIITSIIIIIYLYATVVVSRGDISLILQVATMSVLAPGGSTNDVKAHVTHATKLSNFAI